MEEEGLSRTRATAYSGGCGGGGTKCGRWNPTAEQVKVLTDLFRAGLRTPSSDQIQKISTQLSFYGKIESKNVFYWFQNHKARERQKRRRVSKDHDVPPLNCFQLNDDLNTPIAPTKCFGEIINRIPWDGERAIETLQLFPLNSYHDEQEPSDKLKQMDYHWFLNDCYKENNATLFANYYTIGRAMEHPPLDLRLSFF